MLGPVSQRQTTAGKNDGRSGDLGVDRRKRHAAVVSMIRWRRRVVGSTAGRSVLRAVTAILRGVLVTDQNFNRINQPRDSAGRPKVIRQRGARTRAPLCGRSVYRRVRLPFCGECKTTNASRCGVRMTTETTSDVDGDAG